VVSTAIPASGSPVEPEVDGDGRLELAAVIDVGLVAGGVGSFTPAPEVWLGLGIEGKGSLELALGELRGAGAGKEGAAAKLGLSGGLTAARGGTLTSTREELLAGLTTGSGGAFGLKPESLLEAAGREGTDAAALFLLTGGKDDRTGAIEAGAAAVTKGLAAGEGFSAREEELAGA
jgi:hypothetical protein